MFAFRSGKSLFPFRTLLDIGSLEARAELPDADIVRLVSVVSEAV